MLALLQKIRYLLTSMWDFSLITKKLKDDYSGGVANNLLALLAETRMGAREKTRTSKEYTILVAKRVLGWSLYLVIQAGAMALVVYITVSAGAINSNVANVSFLRSLAPFFSALTMSFLNATVPVLISYITEYEAWDSPSLELNIRLSRMYLSNIFNVVILAASYALLADPMLLGESQNVFLRRSLEITFNSSIHRCRMNQVAESLFTLLISAFVIKVVMMILNPLADILYNRVKGIAYQKTEFDIASGIVSMLYLATLGKI